MIKDLDFIPASPGQTSGPPERCYPPEPAEFDGGLLYLRPDWATGTESPWTSVAAQDIMDFFYMQDEFEELIINNAEEYLAGLQAEREVDEKRLDDILD